MYMIYHFILSKYLCQSKVGQIETSKVALSEKKFTDQSFWENFGCKTKDEKEGFLNLIKNRFKNFTREKLNKTYSKNILYKY